MNTAAKDLRKNYSKKICEKLVLLMKTTIRALANHFKACAQNFDSFHIQTKMFSTRRLPGMRVSSMQSASQWISTLLERSSLSSRRSSVSPRLRYIYPCSFFFNFSLEGEAVCGRGAEDVEQHWTDHHLSEQGCRPVEEIGEAKEGL